MTNFKNTQQRFLKYLKNQFSNADRHDFEKTTQKDPFEQEALEGLASLPVSELEADLSALSKKINHSTKSNKKAPLYYKLGIAASIVLITGISFMFFNKEKKTDFVYDTESTELPSVQLKQEQNSLPIEIVHEDHKEHVIEKNVTKEVKTQKNTKSNISTKKESPKQPEPAKDIVTPKSDDSHKNITSITIKDQYSINDDTLSVTSVSPKTSKILNNSELNSSLSKSNNINSAEATTSNNATPPITFTEEISNKEKRRALRKIRKLRKNKVKIYKLEKAIGVKKEKRKKTINFSKNERSTTNTTLEDFGNWVDINLNSTLFTPNKIYYVKVSFEINQLKKVQNVRFKSNNDTRIQEELKRVLLVAPSWVLDAFNDKKILETIDIELQIIY